MLYLLISIGILLMLFNLFVWLYDKQKLKLSIDKSLIVFKKVSIAVLVVYLAIAAYVYLFIPNTFN
jgi:hypothetical protein